ncbi:stage II sporulation protein M [Paenibacillus sp. HB172176]|uniref:stage II sporulation protein M n=1 Tax=Paenibacillus sp. HB172176 TaxID=2493690 RepID=UPI001F1184B4|nr:stage II sporulation protein M [Paenibacillus sp. HB172176]
MKTHLNLYVFVSVLFLVGGMFGALLFHALTFEQQQDLTAELQRYMDISGTGIGMSETEIFWNRFFFHMKWIILIGVLGVTVIGSPGILILNFLKGTLVGFSVGAIVSEYAWKGILIAMAAVAPQNVVIVPAIIITSGAAISFSLFLIKHRLLQKGGELMPQLGSLASTVILMLLLLAGVSLFEAYVSPSFISWAVSLLEPPAPLA